MRKTVLFIVFLFAICDLHAQQNITDSLTPVYLAKNIYTVQRGNDLPVFNGIQYSPYSFSIEGIPFFLTTEWQKGSVVYEDVLYENISMKYELVRDQVIITPNERGGLYISLFSPRVKEFSFSGFNFIRIDNEPSLNTGFYQQLARGKVSVLARKTKIIEEKAEITGLTRKFQDVVRYYILKNGKYNLIRSKNGLLEILKEHRNEIQQLLKKNNLNYRTNREETIIAAVEFYNRAN